MEFMLFKKNAQGGRNVLGSRNLYINGNNNNVMFPSEPPRRDNKILLIALILVILIIVAVKCPQLVMHFLPDVLHTIEHLE